MARLSTSIARAARLLPALAVALPMAWPLPMPALAALALAALSAAPASAASLDAGGMSVERSVKAAFLYKFLGYVEFPAAALPDAGAPYTVGVIGAEDIAAELSRITAGRNVNGHPVQVRVLRQDDALANLQMLFVASVDAVQPVRLLRAARLLGILTVTEADNGLQQGSVINFRLVEDRIRFEVSLDAADKSNLKLSSRLLAVAYHVQKETP